MSRFSPSSPAWTEQVYGLGKTATRQNTTFDDVRINENWLLRERDLKKLRHYRDDWDGMGASAPPAVLVDAAILYLRNLRLDGRQHTPPSAVSGTPMGRITLEWQFDEENYLEAEIADSFRVAWMQELEGEFREWAEPINNRLLDQLGGPFFPDAVCASAKGQTWSTLRISDSDTAGYFRQR